MRRTCVGDPASPTSSVFTSISLTPHTGIEVRSPLITAGREA